MSEQKKFRIPTADGRMMYLFPNREAFGSGWDNPRWVTEGVELRYHRDHRGIIGAILITPAGVDKVEHKTQDRSAAVTTYVKVTDNPLLPETVSEDDWEKFAYPFGTDEWEDYAARAWYRKEVSGAVDVIETIDLSDFEDFPADVLDPASVEDPAPGFEWRPSPAYLVFGEEFGNAVPGTLTGFSERLLKDVESRLSKAKVWTHEHAKGVVRGYRKLKYEDRRTFPLHRPDKRKRQEYGISTKQFDFEIPFTKNLSAASKVQAMKKYQSLVDSIVEQIDNREVDVCAHCSGAGIVEV
ncbi:hypothetical protein ACFVAJ_18460 [Agromyces sp. NPDC057679]|uniref:hypothetical protein n=1 Tax=Agromyces sp. NPDC057679 TaxID=3346207 RepID=UPI00366FBE97